MASIPEVRAQVYAEVKELVAVVERGSPQTATEVELALWAGMLRLGASMMGLFFAHQAARWPAGLRYEVSGVGHEVVGGDVADVGTRFGKVSVLQPIGRVVGKSMRA